MADLERLSVVWEIEDGGLARSTAAELRERDPDAEIDVREPRGILPAPVIIAGAIAIIALGNQIVSWTCRLRKPALKFDATLERPKLVAAPELPNGLLLVYKANGNFDQHDLCTPPGLSGEQVAKILSDAVAVFKGGDDKGGDDKGGDDKGGDDKGGDDKG